MFLKQGKKCIRDFILLIIEILKPYELDKGSYLMLLIY